MVMLNVYILEYRRGTITKTENMFLIVLSTKEKVEICWKKQKKKHRFYNKRFWNISIVSFSHSRVVAFY
jgi:hypothetical protein